uniref:Uncharacterized protein n=1 Tax=Lotharella oceanica TaxID=641309 RepID=A0A7S2TJD1_9EUKA|mmetsp:Transcript_16666/g.31611  ORF Transcript_16666/g.31611 Transcript_16666/m.31611 type:complete len:295 (+) Transcript_16666:26-910(+)
MAVLVSSEFRFKLDGPDGGVLGLSIDMNRRMDCSIPVSPEIPSVAREKKDSKQCEAFNLPSATCEPVKAGNWVARVSQGASVNVDVICFCAHGNGTHAECVGHITKNPISIEDSGWEQGMMLATLITVEPEQLKASGESYNDKSKADDWVITRRRLKAAMEKIRPQKPQEDGKTWWSMSFYQAVLVRTTCPAGTKVIPATRTERKSHKWSNTNPPYFTTQAAALLAGLGNMRTLLVDVPSVDREDDGGSLIVHRAIFQLPCQATSIARKCRLVTETCCFPDPSEVLSDASALYI